MLNLNNLTNDISSYASCKFWSNLTNITSYVKKFLLSKFV